VRERESEEKAVRHEVHLLLATDCALTADVITITTREHASERTCVREFGLAAG
jgi:hypothetical protein